MPEERQALVGNAADKSQVADAKRKEKLRRDRELDDLRAVLALPEARRFLWRLLGTCHIWESSFVSTEMLQFREGERNVGLFVLREIDEAEKGLLLDMMRENQIREITDA